MQMQYSVVRIGYVLSTLRGRVLGEHIRAIVAEWDALNHAPVWLIDGMDVTSYSADAMAAAIRLFGDASSRGLRRIVTALKSPTVIMGARTVSMALTVARANMTITVASSLNEAIREATTPR